MNKIFLSLASGPGIGLATARRFAQNGYDVVLTARNTERLQPAAGQLKAFGVKVDIHKIDANDPQAVAALVHQLGDKLHVLHYNGATLHFQGGELQTRTLDDESVESIMSDLNVNVVSALTAIRAASDVMKSRGSGTVLVTGGGFAFEPSGLFFTLSVGKAALRAAVQALFEPLKAQGIHIASVTVTKGVASESQEANDIADAFWNLHTQPVADWSQEVVY